MHGLLDLIFPPRCVACEALLARPDLLCDACACGLLPAPSPACPICGVPVDGEGEVCVRCAGDPPAFDRAVAAFAFAGPLLEAVPRFKYRDKPHLAAPLVELAWPALQRAAEGCELLAPIPLHRGRLRERGYDQALLIAREMRRWSGLPVDARLLRRVRATAAQVGSSARDRAENLRGAFQAAPHAAGKRVGLVDDVVTTTATAREAARALKDAGARSVTVLALARAF